MNKAILIGNLTREPEKRGTPSGISLCTFTIAVSRRFTTQQGERQADFIPIVTWRGLADNCANYLHEGSKVAVLGEIRTRSYEAPDGSKRYVTEIQADEVQFLDRAPQSQNQGAAAVPQEFVSDPLPDFATMEDEELPF
ncbi:MAG: single-stranded DNA-binding protein [Bacillota bacterium]